MIVAAVARPPIELDSENSSSVGQRIENPGIFCGGDFFILGSCAMGDGMGILKRSTRRRATKIAGRQSSPQPHPLHILAVNQHYVSTSEHVEDAYLPAFTGAHFFNKPLPPPLTTTPTLTRYPRYHGCESSCVLSRQTPDDAKAPGEVGVVNFDEGRSAGHTPDRR